MGCTQPEWGFTQADRFPPATTPPKHFQTLPRRIYALVTQCRTRYTFIGEYYARHVPTEDPSCPCGAKLQTRRHILLHCPRYEAYRPIPREASPGLVITDILGTTIGIQALAHFIKQSGAFTKTGNYTGHQS